LQDVVFNVSVNMLKRLLAFAMSMKFAKD